MATREERQASPAKLSLIRLQNCFVNLPSSLFSTLVNLNTPAQNVVVELKYRAFAAAGSKQSTDPGSSPRSVFLGWTGMQSRQRASLSDDRDSPAGGRTRGIEREPPLIDIDSAFAQTLGLRDGQDVTVLLHLEPPLVQTVNIEPLTPEDWEIIELHANFLEFNLVRQVRALPNPGHTRSNDAGQTAHPITLHLSPTTTANIKLVSLDPAPDSPFAKLSPDAEVIIAPKSRPNPSRSLSRAGSSREANSSGRGRGSVRVQVFLRGIDRSRCSSWFDHAEDANEGLRVWVDSNTRLSESLRGITWVSVSILHQSSFQTKVNSQHPQEGTDGREAVRVAHKVVARLEAWRNAPDNKHAALSSALCAALASDGMVGIPVKIEAAPEEYVPRKTTALALGSNSQRVHLYPFLNNPGGSSAAIRLGALARKKRQDGVQSIANMYKQPGVFKDLLDGPITDGFIMGPFTSTPMLPSWVGGILRFDTASNEPANPVCNWFLGLGRSLSIEIEEAIPSPLSNSGSSSLPEPVPVLAGVDNILSKIKSHLLHQSSVLLIGGPGSGKSSAAILIGHQLRSGHFFHSTYLSCQNMSANEERIAAIKDTLEQSFLQAALSARLGGQAIVILDDIDKLCPVETELEVGGENARAKQMSEIVALAISRHCPLGSGVTLLATAQTKESLHNVIVGNHLFQETLALDASYKECRKKILEMIIQQGTSPGNVEMENNSVPSRPETADGARLEHDSWPRMGVFGSTGSAPMATATTAHPSCTFAPDVDFADLANLTESYMPRDLILLVERAKYAALGKFVSGNVRNGIQTTVPLEREHFDEALEGFTPLSLRNMSLATSAATFDSIGGMTETRRVLLETIEYPTRYAPIFAQCPLRLRSGLLLYGYPGCGKTLLASAVAGECGLNFISVKGPEVLNKYIGASEKSIRDLFERAAASRPCVLFFDEFDSIAPKRGSDSTGVTDRVVNQLLTQMDGVEGLSGVYVLAATSRPDLIDPALLRPGRLDKSLLCDLPHLEDRADILKCLLRKMKLAGELAGELADELDEKLNEVAARTQDYSGADLQALVSNAQLEAIHEYLGHKDPTPRLAARTNVVARGVGAMRKTSTLQFRFGGGDLESSSGTRQSQLMEIAEYEETIARLRAREKSARAAHRGLQSQTDKKSTRNEDDKPEVLLAWRHLERSLRISQASIKTDEKQRLSSVYHEFVGGRDAELRNGQGGAAVGSRGTLI
ncbi:peroxisome biosynthesis protein-like protein (PAS1/Peroxin-1) [Colletotrichum falcatum]|nr:peroxisome biosynthesis protein-like protein (PAS1/Peroxin-1) [Colletotrichum falcatum]